MDSIVVLFVSKRYKWSPTNIDRQMKKTPDIRKTIRNWIFANVMICKV